MRTGQPWSFPAAGRADFMIAGSYDHILTGTTRDHEPRQAAGDNTKLPVLPSLRELPTG
jgi:hypothetical protein